MSQQKKKVLHKSGEQYEPRTRVVGCINSGTFWLSRIGSFFGLSYFDVIIMYITNYDGSVNLPYEDGLLEWLQEHYPHSQYRIEHV